MMRGTVAKNVVMPDNNCSVIREEKWSLSFDVDSDWSKMRSIIVFVFLFACLCERLFTQSVCLSVYICPIDLSVI